MLEKLLKLEQKYFYKAPSENSNFCYLEKPKLNMIFRQSKLLE